MKDKNVGNYRRTRRNTEDNLNFGDIPEVATGNGKTEDIDVLKEQTIANYRRYGNKGCQISKGGMQNQIDFWPKVNLFIGNYYNL